jgi:hypothetical protein
MNKKRILGYAGGYVLAFALGCSLAKIGKDDPLKGYVRDRLESPSAQQFVMNSNPIEIKNRENLQEATLEALTRAHQQVCNLIEYDTLSYNIFTQPDVFARLPEGKGRCQEFALLTYAKFLDVADKNNLSDMKNKVRVSMGRAEGKGHMWLEIFYDSEWRCYDTTSMTETPGRESTAMPQLYRFKPTHKPEHYFQIASSGKKQSIPPLQILF